ncbi:hypothetical protein [Planomicrobium okeanokoites]|uniref:hypothetical protein n=1 Tax=Planomicrobium okeanokoites TaxID=244 RepID=UPI0030F56487
MAKRSGGMFGKLVLLGIGAAIGSAMAQKKVDSNGTSAGTTGSSQSGNVKENVKKGLDRFNEQSGGLVDKAKPYVSKAVDQVKNAIDSQQKMMDQEKDMLDKADKTLQDEVGENSKSGSSSSTNTGSSKQSEAGKTGSPFNDSTPSGGAFGGSTEYTDSLKKGIDEDSSKKDKSDTTFDK